MALPILRIGALAVASILLLVQTALRAEPQRSTAAMQGSVCTFGPYRYGAVGNALPTAAVAEGDKTGPTGNEVRQIFRIFYVTASPYKIGFAGWLLESFDHRFDYAPAEINITATNLGALALQVVVPSDADNIPLKHWIGALAVHSKGPIDDQLREAMSQKLVGVALSPCFTEAWNGR